MTEQDARELDFRIKIDSHIKSFKRKEKTALHRDFKKISI